MNYTLRIVKEGVADLDGTTPLDLDAAGVTVDNSEPGVLTVTVPDGVALGSFDPGEVLERGKLPSGNVYFIDQMSAVSAAAYNTGASNLFGRSLPGGSLSETLVDLATNDGVVANGRFVFLPDTSAVLLTDVGGPHDLHFLVQLAEDEDFENAVVGGGGAVAAGGNPPLTLVFESPTTVAPYIFGTWAEVLSAVGDISVAASGSRTPFDLYLADAPAAGAHELGGGNIQGFAPEENSTVKRTGIVADSTWSITSLAKMENLSFTSSSPLSSPIFALAEATVELNNVSASQPLNGGTTDPWFSTTAFETVYLLNDCAFFLQSFDVGAGISFTLDIQGSTSIASSAISDDGVTGNTAVLRIRDPRANVSIVQGATIDLDIGSGVGGAPSYGGGSEFMFSCGSIDFAAILAASGDAALFAGGAFAGPAATWALSASPQTPPFAPPARGFIVPRDCYIRGIGVRIPTTSGSDDYTLEVYVGGSLVITEGAFSSFHSGLTSAFESNEFGVADQGDSIEVVIVPAVGGTAVLPEGMIVTVRAS